VRDDGYNAIARKDGATYGNLNCWYLEDDNFIADNGIPDFFGVTDVDFFGSLVVRHCTFDITACTNSKGGGVFDAHGNQNYWSGSAKDYTGLYRYEAYNNTIKTNKVYRFGYFRGGRLLFYNNTFTTTDGSSAPMLGLTEEEGWMTVVGWGTNIRTTWPGEEQINNSFFFNNTLNGQPFNSVQPWNPNDEIFIQENRDYWFKAPDSTTVTNYPACAVPPSKVGFPYNVGTSYWPTTTSYSTAVYPHPLVTGGKQRQRQRHPRKEKSSTAWRKGSQAK
jgi:hypothetical protein